MTDYFALLQQRRQPWLDPNELKERYQELVLLHHPDQKTGDESTIDFAEVNEAYRCLIDPKRRLQHLLQLEGNDPKASQTIPAELFDLFARISNFVETTDPLLSQSHATQNALARSLLQSKVIAARREAEEILDILRALYEESLAATKSLNARWESELETLKQLYLRFAYLTRWIAQVEERHFQLSTLA